MVQKTERLQNQYRAERKEGKRKQKKENKTDWSVSMPAMAKDERRRW
jgi:hypothetical protein